MLGGLCYAYTVMCCMTANFPPRCLYLNDFQTPYSPAIVSIHSFNS